MIERDDRLLTELGLAQWLGVPRAWVRTETKAGRIPCVRAGRRVLYSSAAVEAAIRSMARHARDDGGARREGVNG